VFNTTLLIGPEGILSRYRKVNPWIPWEVHASPADIEGYGDALFPVVETEIGRLGVATCYDWLFPEVTRELVLNGAEILIRISAYMDPWGATPPMDWWTVVNRCRALENVAYVVAANQAASLENYPPFSWPGGSMVVDFDGRILAQADPGAGEKIVIAPLDLAALRAARKERLLHNFVAHRRAHAYPAARAAGFRGPTKPAEHSIEGLTKRIEDEKKRLGYGTREA
jgi:predicted amidohydrolase